MTVEFYATSTAIASGTTFSLPRAGFIQILSSGKPGTPPCKSGQLEKDLELEVSSLRHAARLIIFEIMIWIELSHLVASRSPLIVRVDPDLVQIEKQARWKANAAISPGREMIHEPNILTVGKCPATLPRSSSV